MKKVVFFGSILLVLSLLSHGILASDPFDYKIVYYNHWTHDHENRSMTTTVLSQANIKFRMESEYPDDPKDAPKPAPVVWIVRFDKHVTWRLDAAKNICMEQPYDENRVGRSFFISQERKGHLKKVGEEKVLDYPCDIFLDDAPSPAKYWISKEHAILLKSEYDLNGDKYISEATELRFEPQDNASFDLPQGYKMLKIMSKEDIDKLPPVTLKDIESSIFAEYRSILLSQTSDEAPRRLTAAEIECLRDSFKNGSDLEEIANGTLGLVTNNPAVEVFTIEWSGKEISNFYFDKIKGYLYISKMNVFHNELKERYFDVNWVKKFVQGAYRFKPSSEFLKLLK